MCAARKDNYYDRPRRERYEGKRSGGDPHRGRGGQGGGYPPRRDRYPSQGGRDATRAPSYGDKGRDRPRPSDPPAWGKDRREPPGPELDDKEDEERKEGEGISKENLAMIAGVLYMLMAIYLFFMFFWREGGREIVMFEFAMSLIVISIMAVFLSLSHDLRFMPAKMPVYWTNFISGLLTMSVLLVMVKMFKDFSSGKYDIIDDFNVIVSVALGTGATYLLLHSMFFERKEPFVMDKVPMAFLSGFAWASLGGTFYFFFIDEPFTRLADAPDIFYIAIVMLIIGSLAVFFNLLDNTYFAPEWATKKHMNFMSGILLGVVLFMVLITALMYNSDPYEIWDTLRVVSVTGIASFAMATGVFSMGM